jgi:hypothetical protein
MYCINPLTTKLKIHLEDSLDISGFISAYISYQPSHKCVTEYYIHLGEWVHKKAVL